MPWRTVCEVVGNMRQMGHDATLLSLGGFNGTLSGGLIPGEAVSINKVKDKVAVELAEVVSRHGVELVYWPLTWRDPLSRIKAVGASGARVVGWFPGGAYGLSASLYAGVKIGFLEMAPYIIESVSVRKSRMEALRRNRFESIITMTDATARDCIASGWPEGATYVVPPGKDVDLPRLTGGERPADFTAWLGESPYYLFMGPPGAIRGVYELLEAFELSSKRSGKFRLVCLFRADGRLDSEKIRATISRMKSRGKIYVVWESLPKDQLNAFMEGCHAAIMPFLLVPSEIPLSIIEVIAWGKPVLTTSPGGTGEFVEPFGASPRVGDIAGLSEAMDTLVADKSLYARKCKKAREIFAAHPTWFQVARKWLDAAHNKKDGLAG